MSWLMNTAGDVSSTMSMADRMTDTIARGPLGVDGHTSVALSEPGARTLTAIIASIRA